MLEVQARAGVARVATFPIRGVPVTTPNVLFAVTTRHPAPSFGDVLLSEVPLNDPRPALLDRGSMFRAGPKGDEPMIPPDSARPSTLPDLERPASEGATVVVASATGDVEAHPESGEVGHRCRGLLAQDPGGGLAHGAAAGGDGVAQVALRAGLRHNGTKTARVDSPTSRSLLRMPAAESGARSPRSIPSC